MDAGGGALRPPVPERSVWHALPPAWDGDDGDKELPEVVRGLRKRARALECCEARLWLAISLARHCAQREAERAEAAAAEEVALAERLRCLEQADAKLRVCMGGCRRCSGRITLAGAAGATASAAVLAATGAASRPSKRWRRNAGRVCGISTLPQPQPQQEQLPPALMEQRKKKPERLMPGQSDRREGHDDDGGNEPAVASRIFAGDVAGAGGGDPGAGSTAAGLSAECTIVSIQVLTPTVAPLRRRWRRNVIVVRSPPIAPLKDGFIFD
eukprot:NODE_14756_length_1088_cov_7.185224.p2 GENE.NODE_14756_length_1088_cov_7.185224~~NODE_14756_length_1088_cov_7.185224.p2  ORF type:complete len:270 (+),score=59.28 NODE_14756_length_1088_cov_7.185224:263-1072(+)